MKKVVLSLFVSLSLLLSVQANVSNLNRDKVVQSKESVVYITRTGTKYHRDYCGYLRKSKIKTSLNDAVKRGYSACSKCF